MTKINCKTNYGYIEGYYGRILTWGDRSRILERLKKNKLNMYFYAPKEDTYHRKNWREPYNYEWKENFNLFCETAQSKKIDILFGVSPGIDFSFKNLDKTKKDNDFKILLEKCLVALKLGAQSIVLQFDDIPDNFSDKNKNISEGEAHARLANKLSDNLKCEFYVVPRIYSDELIIKPENYLLDFGLNIKKSIKVFYCGKNVVEKKINQNSLKTVTKFLKNEIIIWDNYYANDYCPSRLFLGPWINRSNEISIMINPTGLIETDLLIIDIVGTQLKHNKYKNWRSVIIENNIPFQFFSISKYFKSPDFTDNSKLKTFNYSNNDIRILDYLLWNWHSNISREWYPFLMGLKVDLQINLGVLPNNRIIKTQTNPLAYKILEKELNK